MTLAIPAVDEAIIVSINYGDGWAMLFDNEALGWLVDEAGGAPTPVILGTMPPAVEDEASPQWGEYRDPYLLVPDHSRQTFDEFLTWLSSNGGDDRKLNGEGLFSPGLKNGFQQWAAMHPTLVFEGLPPASEPEAEQQQQASEHRHHHRHRGRGRG